MAFEKLISLLPLLDLSESPVTIKGLTKETELKPEELEAEIQNYNHQFSQQILVKNQQVIFSKKVVKQLSQSLFYSGKELILQEFERRQLIYLLLFSEDELLSIFHFQDLLQVSKNTILTDLRKLRLALEAKNVSIDYSRKTGFVLVGKEMIIREVGYQYLVSLLENPKNDYFLGKWILEQNLSSYLEIKKNLKELLARNDLKVIPARLKEAEFFIWLLRNRQKKLLACDYSVSKAFKQLKIYQVSQKFIELQAGFQQEQGDYLFVFLMTIMHVDVKQKEFEFIMDICAQVIAQFERSSASVFRDYKTMLYNLYSHMVPAYFRINYGFKIPNQLATKISHNYAELYQLTKQSLKSFEGVLSRDIPESEYAFFAFLFGSCLKENVVKDFMSPAKAIIICPNGITTSFLLESELKELFPMIRFERRMSQEELGQETVSHYDLIFSSIPVKSAKPVFVVSPFLDYLDKLVLVKQVQEQFLLAESYLPEPSGIISALMPYIEVKKGITREKLEQVISRKIVQQTQGKKGGKPMLSELLTKDKIHFMEESPGWQEAINQVAEPLIGEYIEASYPEAIIKKIKDYGAYIDIGFGIALPHARPEDGVKKIGMSLLKLAKPIYLLDDPKHEITVLICLAAVDNNTHLRALASLTKILSNKEKLHQLLEAVNATEIIEIIQSEED